MHRKLCVEVAGTLKHGPQPFLTKSVPGKCDDCRSEGAEGNDAASAHNPALRIPTTPFKKARACMIKQRAARVLLTSLGPRCAGGLIGRRRGVRPVRVVDALDCVGNYPRRQGMLQAHCKHTGGGVTTWFCAARRRDDTISRTPS